VVAGGLKKKAQRGQPIVGMALDLRVAFFKEQSLLGRDVFKEILKLRGG